MCVCVCVCVCVCTGCEGRSRRLTGEFNVSLLIQENAEKKKQTKKNIVGRLINGHHTLHIQLKGMLMTNRTGIGLFSNNWVCLLCLYAHQENGEVRRLSNAHQ